LLKFKDFIYIDIKIKNKNVMRKMGIRREKKLKNEFLVRYAANMATLYITLSELSIPTSAFYRWKKEDDDFRNRILDIDAEMLDMVEGKLMEKIEQGDLKCIMFYLRCKGGVKWNPTKHIQQMNYEPLRINIISPDGTSQELIDNTFQFGND